MCQHQKSVKKIKHCKTSSNVQLRAQSLKNPTIDTNDVDFIQNEEAKFNKITKEAQEEAD